MSTTMSKNEKNTASSNTEPSANPALSSSTPASRITLKISGLGHSFTLEQWDASTTTLRDVKRAVEEHTSLPVPYQRLLARGKTLEQEPAKNDGNSNMNEGEDDDNDNDDNTKHDDTVDNQTLQDLGIANRTKIMLMHNSLYARDKDGLAKIQQLNQELDALVVAAEGRNSASNNNNGDETKQEPPQHVIHELVTQICCKLDAIDVSHSNELRQLRKRVLRKAQALG